MTLAAQVAAGLAPRRTITAAVTPGGGKSLLASVFAHELLGAEYVDAVCIACPRDSLRHQACESFTAPKRGLNRRLSRDTNRSLAQRSLFESGYATTYQSIAAAPGAHLDRFRRERYLLVLDEPHHLVEEGGASWVEALRPLVESATTVLAMSGTLARHDRRPIPFLHYDDDDHRPAVDIKYSRRDALRERAVLPLEVHFLDGKIRGAQAGSADLVSLSDGACSLRSVLDSDDYRRAFLRMVLDDFETYRGAAYPSRALVVCHNQGAARDAAAMVKRETGLRPVLAISDEPDAQRLLHDFRAGRGDVLITVSMAAEGFDAPDISHLACLSDIRSVPWLDQCIARATRMNYGCDLPWEKQRAYIFAPDDPAMATYLNGALEEQLPYAPQESPFRSSQSEGRGRARPALPVYGEVSRESVGDDEGHRLLDADWESVAEIRRWHPVLHCIDATVLASVARQLRAPSVP